MNFATKWLYAALLALGLLTGGRGAHAAAQTADPAIWGLYGQLVGTAWKTNGSIAEWQWGPDNSIVETRSFMMKTVIRPGANPGELVSVYGGGLHTYDGRIAADGSILWIRRGRFLKMPSRVSIVDGLVVEEMVKLDDANQVAKVTNTARFEQTAGPTVHGDLPVATAAIAPVDVAAAPEVPPSVAVAAANPPPAVVADANDKVDDLGRVPALDDAQWGAYAQLVGHSVFPVPGVEHRWRMAPSGEAVLREVLNADGTIVQVDVIKVVGPSLLGLLRSNDCPGWVCPQLGQVGATGVVTWKEPNAAGGGTSDRDISLRGRELVDFWKGTGKEEPWYVDLPHLRPAPRHYPLTISTAITDAQRAESDRKTAGMEGAVATELGKVLAKEQAELLDRERRQRSQQRVRSFNRAMGSLNGVLTQASDVASANEAASRASLDTTLATIAAQAEAQRQAQAEAQRRAQQQAAEEQRRQLAENARWVAEKEQAAAEYRAGQTQAAATREAQLASQQRDVEQRRATAAVDRRNAEQTALRDQQRLHAQTVATTPSPMPAAPDARPVRQADAGSSMSSGSAPQAKQDRKLHFFFINVGGVAREFVGPTRLTPAEATAEWARVRADAASRYGSGAQVTKHATSGSFRCGFVYQQPGDKHFTFGSDQTLQLAAENAQGKVSNLKATILEAASCE